MRKLFFIVFCLGCCLISKGQSVYGTTGLLEMPTAEMQNDKTLLIGGTLIDHRVLSRYWSERGEYNPFTYNYYVSITMFPWLEVAYTCTLVKGLYNSQYWPERTWGKFVNQDRSFHFRVRLLEEGRISSWMPQIVLGLNDPGSHSDNGGGSITLGGGNTGNHNFLTRYYLALTKHFTIHGVGILASHISWVKGNGMYDAHYSRPAIGFNFLIGDNAFSNKIAFLKGLNLIGEICPGHDDNLIDPTYNVNVGIGYTFWKDHINLIAELDDGQYFSGGIQFKVHL